MSFFTGPERQQLVKLFLQFPNITNPATRSMLISSLPSTLRNQIPTSGIPGNDIQQMVDLLEDDGAQQRDGSWPILLVIERAISSIEGSLLESNLQNLVDAAKQRHGANNVVEPVVDRIKLRQILATYFSDGELRTLMFDLGWDYEDLPGSGKADKARELVALAERRQRLPELVAQIKKERPDITW
jgi:hypothetical protein